MTRIAFSAGTAFLLAILSGQANAGILSAVESSNAAEQATLAAKNADEAKQAAAQARDEAAKANQHLIEIERKLDALLAAAPGDLASRKKP